jgi:hypothetical protein
MNKTRDTHQNMRYYSTSEGDAGGKVTGIQTGDVNSKTERRRLGNEDFIFSWDASPVTSRTNINTSQKVALLNNSQPRGKVIPLFRE